MNVWLQFQQVVSAHPDRPAFLQGDTAVSYRELSARALDYRSCYQSSGVRCGDRVLVWAENGAESAAAILAAWGEGAIAALMDASYCALQLQRAVELLQPVCLVYQSELPDAALTTDCRVVRGRDVLPHAPQTTFAQPTVGPTDPASVIFTSGSTGGPRGVTQSHGNLIRGSTAVSNYLCYRPQDRVLCPVPWSFDYGFGQLLSTLVGGLTQVLPTHSNPFGIGEAIERHRPTVLAGTPTVYGLLTGGMSPIAELDVSALRLLTSSGGKMPCDLVAALERYFPGVEISLNYGLTETYRSCFLPTHLAGKRPGAIGQAIPGVDVVVVRPDGSLAEVGEVGELVHRGDYIMLGYWNDRAGTDRVLRVDPLASGNRETPKKALFTGDLGYLHSDGLLYFVGRSDHQLKSMGVKVNPHEVESLVQSVDGVGQAAVFGIEHDILGDEIWVAYVPAKGEPLKPMVLRQQLLGLMSPYMLPRQYLLLDALPKNVNGKVDYSGLRALAMDPARRHAKA